jgi:hypothetical protein
MYSTSRYPTDTSSSVPWWSRGLEKSEEPQIAFLDRLNALLGKMRQGINLAPDTAFRHLQ